MPTESDKDRKLQTRISPVKDDYFMGILMMRAVLCHDPVVQAAACIVDYKDRDIAFGVSFIEQPLYGKKIAWTERNRNLAMTTAIEAAVDRALKIYVSPGTTTDCLSSHTVYSTGPITVRDARKCGSHGVKTVVYGPMTPYIFDEMDWIEAQELAKVYNITLKKFEGNLNWLRDRIHSLEQWF